MKTNNNWTKTLTGAAKGFLCFAAVLALLPASVKAGCAFGWEVSSDRLEIQQGETTVYLDLRQSGTVVTGRAAYGIAGIMKPFLGIFTKSTDPRLVFGAVAGTITGDNFHLQIMWDNKATGVYEGTIGPNGQLAGNTYDIKAPSRKVSWSTDTHLTCKPSTFIKPPAARPSGSAH